MLTDLMGGEMTVTSTPGVGTRFTIRLFLPQVAGRGGRQHVLRRRASAMPGERRRIWVVDNEEADRGLLVRILEPLGFEVRRLASGEDCLALLREAGCHADGWRPDAIFMDLAMPGLDGWATLRAIQTEGLCEAPAAIVSANAFDKALDNDVGIRPEDFIVKPVRVAELLDWLGRRLGLQWIEAERLAGRSAAVATESLAVPAGRTAGAAGAGQHRLCARGSSSGSTRSRRTPARRHMRGMARGSRRDEAAGCADRVCAAHAGAPGRHLRPNESPAGPNALDSHGEAAVRRARARAHGPMGLGVQQAKASGSSQMPNFGSLLGQQ